MSCGSAPGSRPGTAGSRWSTSPARPRARRASWPWSSPASSACRCGPGPTSPTSPTRSARSSSTPRTDLVLVDEIHNLNHGTPAGEDLSDHLKYFTEHLPATFIYAGIDVERCGVFTGTRGRQLV